MPEIPELEGLVGFLDGQLAGTRFADVQIAAISAVKTADPPFSALGGREVARVGRRGKFLWIATQPETGTHIGPSVEPREARARPELGRRVETTPTGPSGLYLVTHLSRAGWLRWYDSPPKSRARPGRGPLAARFTFVDEGGAIVGGFDLTEQGTQKRLSLYLVRDLAEIPGIARLGPEPLDPAFTEEVLADLLADAGGRHLKTVLRDQSVIAGIGNAYSDEILHAAKLSPAAASDSLTEEERARLCRAIQDVLTGAIAAASGRPPADLKDGKRLAMRVHGRTGERCDVCGDTIREVSGADSSYQYCPTCQTGGKALADRRMSRLLK